MSEAQNIQCFLFGLFLIFCRKHSFYLRCHFLKFGWENYDNKSSNNIDIVESCALYIFWVRCSVRDIIIARDVRKRWLAG